MNKVARISYDETKFYYVDSHYDIHLTGLCIYNGKLHRFISDDSEVWTYLASIDEDDDIDYSKYTIWCDIYKINPLEKLKYLWRKKLFEICVGKHWSYDKDQKIRSSYYVRKPAWLHKFLFKLFYWKALKGRKK